VALPQDESSSLGLSLREAVLASCSELPGILKDLAVPASMITPNPATNDPFKTGHHEVTETRVV